MWFRPGWLRAIWGSLALIIINSHSLLQSHGGSLPIVDFMGRSPQKSALRLEVYLPLPVIVTIWYFPLFYIHHHILPLYYITIINYFHGATLPDHSACPRIDSTCQWKFWKQAAIQSKFNCTLVCYIWVFKSKIIQDACFLMGAVVDLNYLFWLPLGKFDVLNTNSLALVALLLGVMLLLRISNFHRATINQ